MSQYRMRITLPYLPPPPPKKNEATFEPQSYVTQWLSRVACAGYSTLVRSLVLSLGSNNRQLMLTLLSLAVDYN